MWLPIFVAWWFTNTNLYRSEGWIAPTHGTGSGLRPGRFTQLLAPPDTEVTLDRRRERIRNWRHATWLRLSGNEEEQPPALPAYLPDWDKRTVGGRFEARPEGSLVAAVEVSKTAWYIAAWSTRGDRANALANLYGLRLAEYLSAYEETPRTRSNRKSAPLLAARANLRRAQYEERRAVERLQHCFEFDEAGLPDVIPAAVTSSALSLLDTEASILTSSLEELREQFGLQHPQVESYQTRLETIGGMRSDEVLREIDRLEADVREEGNTRARLERELTRLENELPDDPALRAAHYQWQMVVSPRRAWWPDSPLGVIGALWLVGATALCAWISTFLVKRFQPVVRTLEDFGLPIHTTALLRLRTPGSPKKVRADIDAMTTSLTTAAPQDSPPGPHEPAPASPESPPPPGTWPGGGMVLVHCIQAGWGGAAGALAVAQLAVLHAESVLIVDHRDDDALAALVGENNPWKRYQRAGQRTVQPTLGSSPKANPAPTDIQGVWYIPASQVPRRLGHLHTWGDAADCRWNMILRVYADGHRFEADRIAEGSGCVLLAGAGKTKTRLWHNSVDLVRRMGQEDPWAVLVNTPGDV